MLRSAIRVLLTGVLAASAVFAQTSASRSSITVKMDCVGTFNVTGWNIGTAANWNSTPGTATKPQISALNLVKELDDATTQLFKLSLTGASCGGSSGKVVLTQTDPTGGHPPVTITLEDVFVSVYQITGNTGASAAGETISLMFGRITFEYNHHQSTWDVRAQKAI
jgi:type VI protein secretion system component Hcp